MIEILLFEGDSLFVDLILMFIDSIHHLFMEEGQGQKDAEGIYHAIISHKGQIYFMVITAVFLLYHIELFH